MEKDSILHDPKIQLPASFFDVLIQDVSAATWSRLIQHNPSLRARVLEGFSARADRLPRLIRQPQLTARLRRLLQQDTDFLEEVLKVWGQEKLALMAFLEMLHEEFVQENFLHLKNLLGPERLLAGLHLLGFDRMEIHPHLAEPGYWERKLDLEVLEPLIPVFDLWRDLIVEKPELSRWMEELTGPWTASGEKVKPVSESGRGPEPKVHREDEQRRRLEKKLAQAQEEIQALREREARHKKEAAALQMNLTQLQENFQSRLDEALRAQHRAWYRRFEGTDLPALEEAEDRLERVLRRARRAMELQREADDRYGLVAAVRQKLLDVNRILEEMEKIQDQSLVVHTEVMKSKGELQREKKRLLESPGIEKVLRGLPATVSSETLEQHIRLLDASLESLPRLSKLAEVVDRLESVGFLPDAEPLREAIQVKKYQIFAPIYARFEPPRSERVSRKVLPDFEDFVNSGRSRSHDLYVDGYNILLSAQSSGAAAGQGSLTELREEFIRRVVEKSRFFKRVVLVFDGVEDSRDRIQNVEIIYTDKFRGMDADNQLIQIIGKRKDRSALLVTADQQIIDATEPKVFALMDPGHFYLFVFDVDFPFLA